MSIGILCIVQARMSSTRLPGKVMMPILGQPMLARQIERLRRARAIDALCVATSEDATDDAIAALCASLGVDCFRGSLPDVLDRYRQAAAAYAPRHVLRITGDCPLIDPQLIDAVCARHLEAGTDVTGNAHDRSYPDGLDVEVFRIEALERAWREAGEPFEREHVTPYLYRADTGFSQTVLRHTEDLSALRWVVDTPADLEFVREVFAALHPQQPDFNWRAVLSVQRYRESLAALRRAEAVIPGGSQTFSKSRLAFPAGAAPLFLERGQGSRVWDVDGNEYIDFVNGLLAVSLGYADPGVDAAVRRQLERGVSFSLPHRLEAELAEAIVELVPCAEQVRFGKNGSDATAGAVRLARACTGRERVAVCGYHGWQDWYIGSTSRDLGVPEASKALTHRFAYNDLDSLAALFDAHPGEFAAVILEPMTFDWPAPGFLEAVAERTRAHGALLVFDETITGFRFALGGAQQLFGVTPDLACFGKGLANGYPLSVLAGRREFMQRMEDIFFSFTFGGEALSLAAALAVIDTLRREPRLEALEARGERLMQGLAERIERHGAAGFASVRGHPAWSLFGLSDAGTGGALPLRALFVQEMCARGILINASHNLSHAHDDDDIARLLAAYDEVLPLLREAVTQGELPARLRGAALEPVFKVRG